MFSVFGRKEFSYGIGGFLAGTLIASLCIVFFFQPQSPQLKVVRESNLASSTGDALTDPLISVTTGGSNSADYAQLQGQVQQYINAQEQSGSLTDTSVRFTDIEAAENFTVNPSQTYDPASLTKVPLAMAYYDLAENDPSILGQEVTYSGTPDLDATEQIESPTQLTPGQSYTVEELIEHMIKHSDNNAEQLLADHLQSIGQLGALQTLYADLGIQINPNNPDYMTVQSYSLFLRVLFNATYLDREYSEQLLSLMTETDFSSGLDAGVPNNIVVAEKFGDARIPNAQGQQVGAELQNCGIVYYPDHPYILCIMTKGENVAGLEHVIAGISQIVYQSMEQKYPQ